MKTKLTLKLRSSFNPVTDSCSIAKFLGLRLICFKSDLTKVNLSSENKCHVLLGLLNCKCVFGHQWIFFVALLTINRCVPWNCLKLEQWPTESEVDSFQRNWSCHYRLAPQITFGCPLHMYPSQTHCLALHALGWLTLQIYDNGDRKVDSNTIKVKVCTKHLSVVFSSNMWSCSNRQRKYIKWSKI